MFCPHFFFDFLDNYFFQRSFLGIIVPCSMASKGFIFKVSPAALSRLALLLTSLDVCTSSMTSVGSGSGAGLFLANMAAISDMLGKSAALAAFVSGWFLSRFMAPVLRAISCAKSSGSAPIAGSASTRSAVPRYSSFVL